VATAIELLAGIPSIIYGMWGFFVLMPVLREHV
jgi:phosphate transport system permease protein